VTPGVGWEKGPVTAAVEVRRKASNCVPLDKCLLMCHVCMPATVMCTPLIPK
jgi:hypothetical protein